MQKRDKDFILISALAATGIFSSILTVAVGLFTLLQIGGAAAEQALLR